MFTNCKNLTSAPVLPATRVRAEYCYREMFQGCEKLNYIKMLATSVSDDDNSITDWVKGVAATGTFVKNASMSSLPSGNSGIPTGWTVQNATS